jgi:hypothetical protein
MKIAVIPSNQHRNRYVGTGLTEQDWAIRAAPACVAELQRQGHTAQMFWVRGQGAKSTDELRVMMRQARAWGPDAVLSLHSDVGSRTRPRHIYPLIRQMRDTGWGIAVGKNMAARTGFGFQKPTIRAGLLFYTMLRNLRGLRALLLEIGQHNIPVDAAFNLAYAEFLGIMAARAFVAESGVSIADAVIPAAVAVPPGQERWHVGPPIIPSFTHLALPVLKLTKPLMSDVADGPTIFEAPIHWLQRFLLSHYPDVPRFTPTGNYGPVTEGLIKRFGSEHYYLGKKLRSDGMVDAAVWGKVLSI